MKNEELREIQSFKAVSNKKTKKWIVLAKFRNGKTKIVAGGLNSRNEAQEYLKFLVEDIKFFLKDKGMQSAMQRLSPQQHPVANPN